VIDEVGKPSSTNFRALGSGSGNRVGVDGDDPGSTAWQTTGPPVLKAGLNALDKIAPEIFNLLCIPAAANFTSDTNTVDIYSTAAAFCEARRAFLIVDIPESVDTAVEALALARKLPSRNAAIYYPRLLTSDPLRPGRSRNASASGAIAGIYARTDATRGVWKAPAGTDADLRGAAPALPLTDLQNGGLNPFGVNALRNFPVYGSVVWGARTLYGADQRASEWKYVPVRRTSLYLQESLYQGLKWVVFEPNDEPLWAQIRLNVGAFMQGLFRQGAFQGTSPRDAYFVKCDRDTTTQSDINLGIVNIVVGFAPLKPAEFVVVKIQQIAGQIAT
jgi:phage tail sheath protein FI